jgi:hypothetical protein
MLFINPQGDYPRHIGDLLLEYPDWEEGQALPAGWIYVQNSSIPAYNTNTQKLVEESPVLDGDGIYTQKWSVVNLTEEELALASDPIPPHERI